MAMTYFTAGFGDSDSGLLGPQAFLSLRAEFMPLYGYGYMATVVLSILQMHNFVESFVLGVM